MTPHENIDVFLSGEKPERIPISIYGALCKTSGKPADWVPLFERGLVPTHLGGTYTSSAKDVETVTDTYEEDGETIHRVTRKTPVGEIFTTARVTGHTAPLWTQKPWLVTAEDYRVRTWISRHTEIRPAYDQYREKQEQVAPWGMVWPIIWRTPIQNILVDHTGLEQFSYHLIDLEDEVMILYEALLEEFRKIVEIVAEGPGGRYVSCPENFTAETLGPARYERLIVPVYKKHFPVLHQAGKVVGAHYDGKLSSVKHLIADTPLDLIESLTESPEGDMTLGECRTTWPDKLFWNNINVGEFDLPPDELRADIRRRVDAAAPDGRRLAFEISEDLPVNWREGIPSIMDELGY